MIRTILPLAKRLLLGGLMIVATHLAAAAETPIGSSIESRVTLAFTVESDALAAWAPEGWVPVPFPRGPFSGANLITNLIDQRAGYDAEGNVTDPPNRRAVAFLGLAKEASGDAVRIFIYRNYVSDGSDTYGTERQATVTRTLTQSGNANLGRDHQDAWSISTDDGAFSVSLSFTTGKPVWSPNEARPFSAANPAFSRIYRYDQLTDLLMSTALGKPLSGSFEMSTDIPELAAVFDGSESLVAIADVPVYVRKISLP
ncbi:hypothetical protein [Aestuariicoccus sp. MJ-SS9]|uniref:hypothetical protein n=1 Tax=Aestuariicoccus sp. MJ-SS9 TaxID=3079855 RepID=UPI002912F633|nr:hypothetical protein [Aestuariicoccus sp. MJ-SS9]MDU8911289.1 hypothetical protein [Aestuariicoccus sp. MJ-SS9]